MNDMEYKTKLYANKENIGNPLDNVPNFLQIRKLKTLHMNSCKLTNFYVLFP